MSYTPTVWQNLGAPAINATNLNKIEQGIKVNSDAIDVQNTKITEVTNLANEAKNLANSNNDRINNLIFSNGDGTKDTELVDLRYDPINDIQYDSAGARVEAINKELEENKNKFDLNNVYQEIKKRLKNILNITIVGYGDSNTRYYEGDTGGNGSISFAYTSYIDVECARIPALYGATVINRGYPGETSSYGVANFSTNVTSLNANVCVLGFGTNNIKLVSNTLETYLSDMESLISSCLTNNILPIVLGIPWFSLSYVNNNQVLQDRLPVWNESLRVLCDKYQVPFIETYYTFKDNPAIYFNEASNKRHYSKIATKILANKIIDAIMDYIVLDSKISTPKYFLNELNSNNITNITKSSGSIDFIQYELDTHSFSTLQINSGSTITMKIKGKTCLGFYPRATATATIGGDVTKSVSITNTIDVGKYYPIVRVAFDDVASTATKTITITATSGNLYLYIISCEELPTGLYSPTTQVALATLATDYVANRVYYCANPMQKTVIAKSDGRHIDVGTGYYAFGNNADRTTTATWAVKGYKFYDTQDSQLYRYDGTNWLTM